MVMQERLLKVFQNLALGPHVRGGRPSERAKILKDIIHHPTQHYHNIFGLIECCLVGGEIDLALVRAHSRYATVRMRHGVRCNVTRGICSCGRWH